MPFGLRRGYTDRLEKRTIENLRAAAAFAHEIHHPLNLTITISWGRTWIGDDPDGGLLDKLQELARKRLKRQYGVSAFAWIEARECPSEPVLRPNTHIMLHCPAAYLDAFKEWFERALDGLCRGLEPGAIKFERTGNGTATLNAVLGFLDYMSKGVGRITGARLGIRPSPQGRVYGKRAGVSQDIGPTARRRHREASTLQGAALPAPCKAA